MTHRRSQRDRFIRKPNGHYAPGFDLIVTSQASNSNSQLYTQLTKSHASLAGVAASQSAKNVRTFPIHADRILDAPEIVDDGCLNLLDWNDQNQLAVALSNKLYLWDAAHASASQLLEYDIGVITSLAWKAGSTCLAVGDSSATVKVFDLVRSQEVRSLASHADRVASLAWNGNILSSGSRDAHIIHHDIRAPHYFVKSVAHEEEVCGLKWNGEGTALASGSNDHRLCLWEPNSATPRHCFKAHTAAVKALAWCPWKANCLASGGASGSIKLWETSVGECSGAVNTYSEVCALEWSRHAPELVSAHGHAQLSLWQWPDMTKLTDFLGHSDRILCMAQDPAGHTVATAGADETLRFWSVFKSAEPLRTTDRGAIQFMYR